MCEEDCWHKPSNQSLQYTNTIKEYFSYSLHSSFFILHSSFSSLSACHRLTVCLFVRPICPVHVVIKHGRVAVLPCVSLSSQHRVVRTVTVNRSRRTVCYLKPFSGRRVKIHLDNPVTARNAVSVTDYRKHLAFRAPHLPSVRMRHCGMFSKKAVRCHWFA